VFSGCIKNDNESYSNDISGKKLSEIVISGPDSAYYDEKITMSAKIKDSKNVQYLWDFMDGTKTTGSEVEHIYNFEKDFTISYPMIYTVTLTIIDEDMNTQIKTHQIKLKPKSYVFYLNENVLSPITLNHNKKKLGEGFLNNDNKYELNYKFDEEIIVPESEFILKIKIEKSFITNIKQIDVKLKDTEQKSVIQESKIFENNFFDNNKIFEITGMINTKIEIKEIDIEISGFMINKNSNIVYGGENSSLLMFDLII